MNKFLEFILNLTFSYKQISNFSRFESEIYLTRVVISARHMSCPFPVYASVILHVVETQRRYLTN